MEKGFLQALQSIIRKIAVVLLLFFKGFRLDWLFVILCSSLLVACSTSSSNKAELTWSDHLEYAKQKAKGIDVSAKLFGLTVFPTSGELDGKYFHYIFRFLDARGRVITVAYIEPDLEKTVNVTVNTEFVTEEPIVNFLEDIKELASYLSVGPIESYNVVSTDFIDISRSKGESCRPDITLLEGDLIKQKYELPVVWSVSCSFKANLVQAIINPLDGSVITWNDLS